MQRIILILFLSQNLFAQTLAKKIILSQRENQLITNVFDNRWKLSKTQSEKLKNGEVVVRNFVTSKNKLQKMQFKVSAIHHLNCNKVLSILSIYENYSKYMSFITKSLYDSKNKRVYFLLDSPLMPFKMSLSFVIERIKKPGIYPFSFENGLFKNLTGNIEVHEIGEYCLFYTSAAWEGADTKIPDLIIEMFSETLTRKSFEKLFRVSSF